MASELLPRDSGNVASTSSPEVDFALVLSRMIESVQNDPRHLRETVYELARHKLQEQFTHADAQDARPLSNALETAIQGVEAFARKNGPAGEAIRRLTPSMERNLALPGPGDEAAPFTRPRPPLVDVTPEFNSDRRSAFGPLGRLVLLIGLVTIVVIGFIAARQRGLTYETLRIQAQRLVASVSTQAPAASLASTQPPTASVTALSSEVPAAKPSPLVPTAYGIYAVSEDKLYELELLPGRAPDIRVAISAAIATPSRTTLPDGHIRFIVYRRDSATVAADRAEVRVIAKIARATSFDVAGKAIVSDTGDNWVIRNISIPYRTGPSKDDPDMYEIQSENPEMALSPGRYGLILKGQAYDFTVAGAVTDPKQCLERLVATNGQFYSECQKP